jgi:hypothetical protein
MAEEFPPLPLHIFKDVKKLHGPLILKKYIVISPSTDKHFIIFKRTFSKHKTLDEF